MAVSVCHRLHQHPRGKASRCLRVSPVPSSPLPRSSILPPLPLSLPRLLFSLFSLGFPSCRFLSPHVGRILAQGLNFTPTPLSPPCSTRSVISEGQAYVSAQARAGVHRERKPGATVEREFHLSKTAGLNYFAFILGFTLCFGSMHPFLFTGGFGGLNLIGWESGMLGRRKWHSVMVVHATMLPDHFGSIIQHSL